jgi:hypothetical protein
VLPAGMAQVGLTSGFRTGPFGAGFSLAWALSFSFSLSFALSVGTLVLSPIGDDFSLFGLARLAGSMIEGAIPLALPSRSAPAF